jgi:hypothetical protein
MITIYADNVAGATASEPFLYSKVLAPAWFGPGLNVLLMVAQGFARELVMVC